MPVSANKSHSLTESSKRITVTGKGVIWGGSDQERRPGCSSDGKLQMGREEQIGALGARKEILRLNSAMSCGKTDVFVPLCETIFRPHLEHCIHAWAPFLKMDAACLENVQRIGIRMV